MKAHVKRRAIAPNLDPRLQAPPKLSPETC